MAFDHVTLRIPGLKTSADLSSYQYYLLKQQSTAGLVSVITAATDDVCGVLYNEPASGYAAEVAAGGILKGVAGGTITLGTHFWLTPNSTGQLVASSTDKDNVVGYTLETAASGEVFSFVWSPFERSTS